MEVTLPNNVQVPRAQSVQDDLLEGLTPTLFMVPIRKNDTETEIECMIVQTRIRIPHMEVVQIDPKTSPLS